MALTINEIENAKAEKDKKYKLADGGVGCVFSSSLGVGKFSLWRYRFDGTEKNMTFGEYRSSVPRTPASFTSLRRSCFASGINPMAERKAEAEALLRGSPGASAWG